MHSSGVTEDRKPQVQEKAAPGDWVSLALPVVCFTIFVVPRSWMAFMLIALGVIFFVTVLLRNRRTLVNTYWLAFGLTLYFAPWPLQYLIPLLGFVGISFFIKKQQFNLSSFALGVIRREHIVPMVAVILVTSGSLAAWYFGLRPDLSDLKLMLPTREPVLLVLISLVFAVANAVWEEMILKGILWSHLLVVVRNPILVNILNAALFGLMHYQGFPRGLTGVILASVYGLIIGYFRRSTNGLGAPIILHFFADLFIFFLLVLG